MAGSTTEELPCQTTEDAKTMAILLASPSGEDPPEGRRRHPSEDKNKINERPSAPRNPA
jgi:hypothetical protein